MLGHARAREDTGTEKALFAVMNNNDKLINDLIDEQIVNALRDIIVQRVRAPSCGVLCVCAIVCVQSCVCNRVCAVSYVCACELVHVSANG